LLEAKRQRDRTPTFTRKGVRLDADARVGLTPESLALALGKQARAAHVVDACCGAGGNAIGFARAGARVTAIELDPVRLAMAQHNARVYGVHDRVAFVLGDAREHLPRLPADLWFVDVPWGERTASGIVTLALLPLLGEILALRPPTQRAWLKVPAGFDVADLTEMNAAPAAWFGEAPGDERRVKFLLLQL
jgi:SAM-dependent methyltransferase